MTIYQSESDAQKDGEIVELCVFEGTSSMSYEHTPQSAIKQHAKNACQCHANKVYVAARSPMGAAVPIVQLVAFEFSNEK